MLDTVAHGKYFACASQRFALRALRAQVSHQSRGIPIRLDNAGVRKTPGGDSMKGSHATKLAVAAGLASIALGVSAADSVKVGFMLPYSGTYTALGNAIENGFKLYVDEQGGKLGGLAVEYVRVDDESAPAKATDNINKLINRDNVDVVVGTVHSGVAMAMAKVAKDTGTLMIDPNAGADAVTGPMCAPNTSAVRSRTGSRPTRWASSPPRRIQARRHHHLGLRGPARRA